MTITKKLFWKDLIVPLFIWSVVILVFLNVKHLPFDFSDKDSLVLRYFVKALMMVIIPFGIIHLFYQKKEDFGIYFPAFSDSLRLTIRAIAIAGPAGMSFLLIGWLGWGFTDWPGALTLTVVYTLVLFLVPKVTQSLPSRNHQNTPNAAINLFVGCSLLTILIAYYSYEQVPVISKIFYYLFIVGFGEELFFRGYLQSSFNRYFGKPFSIANVQFGWGLVLAALLFGLIHALVTIPPTWPWAVFTFTMGLTFGFIREKDGSILSVALLHGLMDLPLAFFTV